MKKIQIISVFLIFSTSCYSQFISEDSFKDKNLKYKFYEILTGNSEIGISNLASISTADSKLSFKGNVKFSDAILLNLSLNGSINEGVSSLFSGFKVSPSIGSEAAFHIYLDDNGYYNSLSNQFEFKKKQDSLIREHNFKVLRFVDLSGEEVKYDPSKSLETLKKANGQTIPYFIYIQLLKYNQQIVKEKESIKKKNREIGQNLKDISNGFTIKDKVKTTLTNDDIDILTEKMRLKKEEIKQSDESISRLEILKKEYMSKSNIINLFENMETAYIENMEKNFQIKKPEQYKIKWLSLTGNLKNNTIKLFDSSLSFDNQIFKNSFNRRGIELSYNTYNVTLNDFRTYFYRIGISYNIEDNLDDLSSLEIEEVSEVPQSSSSGGSSRTTKEKIVAYKAEAYEQNLKSTLIFIDGYWFITRKNNVAFHFRPEVEFINSNEKFNPGFGVFFSFKTKDKDNPIVNIELFSQLNHILKENGENEKLIDRSSTGITLNFPITFKTNQQ